MQEWTLFQTKSFILLSDCSIFPYQPHPGVCQVSLVGCYFGWHLSPRIAVTSLTGLWAFHLSEPFLTTCYSLIKHLNGRLWSYPSPFSGTVGCRLMLKITSVIAHTLHALYARHCTSASQALIYSTLMPVLFFIFLFYLNSKINK